jgi:hypothetical protein
MYGRFQYIFYISSILKVPKKRTEVRCHDRLIVLLSTTHVFHQLQLAIHPSPLKTTSFGKMKTAQVYCCEQQRMISLSTSWKIMCSFQYFLSEDTLRIFDSFDTWFHFYSKVRKEHLLCCSLPVNNNKDKNDHHHSSKKVLLS